MKVPLYIPKDGHLMSVVVFASGGGGNLLAAIKTSITHPTLLRVNLVVTDRLGIKAIKIAKKYNIPVIARNFEKQCGTWANAKGNSAKERIYYQNAVKFHNKILDSIKKAEEKNRSKFDLVVLSYHRWIHGPLLRYFSGRIINQHAGDLTVMNTDARTRKYIGINPVLSALRDGQKSTRTSTFLVTDGHDTGEILCQGPWVEYTGPDYVTKESAFQHELIQKQKSDWPSLTFALKEIALGNFSVTSEKVYDDGTRAVFYKDEPLSYGGVDIEKYYA